MHMLLCRLVMVGGGEARDRHKKGEGKNVQKLVCHKVRNSCVCRLPAML